MKNRYEELVVLNIKNATKFDRGLTLIQKSVLPHTASSSTTGGVKNSIRTDLELALKSWAEVFTVPLPKLDLSIEKATDIDLITLNLNLMQPRSTKVQCPKIYELCRSNSSIFLAFLNICYGFSRILPEESSFERYDHLVEVIEMLLKQKTMNYLSDKLEEKLK